VTDTRRTDDGGDRYSGRSPAGRFAGRWQGGVGSAVATQSGENVIGRLGVGSYGCWATTTRRLLSDVVRVARLEGGNAAIGRRDWG
jgi:hypothetical protein